LGCLTMRATRNSIFIQQSRLVLPSPLTMPFLIAFACLSFLYIKLFELGVQVTESLSTTDPRLPTTKLICPNSYFRAAALSAPMTLFCCSFASASFTLRNPSSLSVDHLNSKIYTICRTSWIATPFRRLRLPASGSIYEKGHWIEVLRVS